MYRFDKVGFKFNIATQDGAHLALEERASRMAMGNEDQIRQMREKVKDQLEKQRKHENIAETLDGYAAVFIPGGRGSIVDMQNLESLGKLHQSANSKDIPLYMLLRVAQISPRGTIRLSSPQTVKTTSPKFGHLPGYLTEDYTVEPTLRALGCQVQNKGLTMYAMSSIYQHSHAFLLSLALLTSLFQVYRIIPSSSFWMRSTFLNTFQSSQFP